MHSPTPLKVRTLSRRRLLIFVRRNPGLTATQYGRLLNKTYGSISARLYERCSDGDLLRRKGQGATQDKFKSWRYFPTTIPL